MMACYNPRCLGKYDFEHISFFARKRFIEGFSTIELLQRAADEREKEEIALVCLLDVKDNAVVDIQLSCRYTGECTVTDCRDKLRKMIEDELAAGLATA